MNVAIPRKALRRALQMAKDRRSLNVKISVLKGKARFEMCDGEVVEIEGIKSMSDKGVK